MVSKVLLALVAILLAVATIQTLRVSWGQKQTEALTEQLRAAQANVKALEKTRAADDVAQKSKRASLEVIRKEANETTGKIKDALRDEPDWSEQPIPAGVLNSLRD